MFFVTAWFESSRLILTLLWTGRWGSVHEKENVDNMRVRCSNLSERWQVTLKFSRFSLVPPNKYLDSALREVNFLFLFRTFTMFYELQNCHHFVYFLYCEYTKTETCMYAKGKLFPSLLHKIATFFLDKNNVELLALLQ